MKPTPQLLLTVFFCSCISLKSCTLSDNDPKPKTELEKLPPATQEGKNTFGCLVNGKAWFTTSTTNAFGVYQLGHLAIGGKLFDPFQSIGIDLLESVDYPEISTGNYILISTGPFSPEVSFFASSTCYYGSVENLDLLSGELIITKFDKVNFTISGLFEFTLAHDGCDTLKVTDGRFDIMYAP